ncbi:FAD-dependent oxidoreductase [Micromonospora marina]|uniref:FAD-dependent oxidoreductase n=1 Tax=Micromonospora marina TaxID=307120 RepID=UPI003D740C5B
MRTGTWDMVVLGGGVAGLAAARTARRLDAQVLLVADGASGHAASAAGTALIAAAHAAHTVATAGRFGLRCGEPRVDDVAVLAAVRAAARAETDHLRDGTIVGGLYVLDGRAEFTGPDSLRVTGADAVREVRFRRAVIATGCVPAVPLIPGLADADPLTVDDLSRLDRLPGRITVLGGGSAGCELAQALARLGVRVTLIEVAGRLLPNEEPAVGALIGERLHLGLTATGVRRDVRGHVVVDQRLRSANHRVFAAGPVTGSAPLAQAAELQGVQAARTRNEWPSVSTTGCHIVRSMSTSMETLWQRSSIAPQLGCRAADDLRPTGLDAAAEWFSALARPGERRRGSRPPADTLLSRPSRD